MNDTHADRTASPELKISRSGPVLVMTITNPGARNALHPTMYVDAINALKAIPNDSEVGAVVITGEGEHFCGGGDLRRLQQQRHRPREEQSQNIDALCEWIEMIRSVPLPVIAAVEGAAAGGGFSICLACDLIVAAENARFVMSYINVALTPDGGATAALAHALPQQAAFELLACGRACTAHELNSWGMVNRVVESGAALEHALAWARQLSEAPRGAMADIKRLLGTSRARTRKQQMADERDTFVRNLYGETSEALIEKFLQARAIRRPS